ncbi:hypothetical protein SAMN02745166_01604 [Prosthecobacter debontii]|uniref:Uncharacterized protein n=1 Tax=Prosthecobacter debontii TaxID=48467 RepID=A0A1T4XKJ7_9BACT|nr:hypothetical protein SAMN02745166_01604 [Prosthecobacter debontii]
MKSSFLTVSHDSSRLSEIVVGWNSMPAYGQRSQAPVGAEGVQQFIDEARGQSPEGTEASGSFWNTFSTSATEIRLAA